MNNVAEYIEHTLLNPLTNREDIAVLCDEILKYNFLGACVPPFLVREAVKKLESSNKVVSTVIGFPLGYTFTNVKVEETKKVIDEGADEVDVVLNLSAVKSNDWSIVRNEIESIAMATHMRGKKAKMILEVDYLNDAEILKVLDYCSVNEIDFVKTSTGYTKIAVTPERITFLRKNLPDTVSIKASGGIRTKEQALALIQAGAVRLGCSSSVDLVKT